MYTCPTSISMCVLSFWFCLRLKGQWAILKGRQTFICSSVVATGGNSKQRNESIPFQHQLGNIVHSYLKLEVVSWGYLAVLGVTCHRIVSGNPLSKKKMEKKERETLDVLRLHSLEPVIWEGDNRTFADLSWR